MLDKKVVKGEKVTWDLDSVDSDHYLKVVVSSPYETISGQGGKKEKKVELKMSFSNGTHSDVHLITSFSLVSTIDGTETPLDPGPSLVIDTIGPPTSHSYRHGHGRGDESEGDDHQNEDRD
jgi:hypothetical protein